MRKGMLGDQGEEQGVHCPDSGKGWGTVKGYPVLVPAGGR